MTALADKNHGRKVLRRLRRHHPDARCALRYETPFQLLVATILSAQCTDARVNKVTPDLFARFPDPRTTAEGSTEELEELIRSTGFFRNKARAILEAARDIVGKHGGEVPGTLEALVALRGVGRKTANVVLGNAFGVPGITVDTHVQRLSRRLALTDQRDPVKIERDLMQVIPRPAWTELSHMMILHGRSFCPARGKLRCDECRLADICPTAE